ncbi:MAG: MFS transporter [Proteobacteria bacterium]|nr:MFS transporter [Pseudomonadota bacterium]
MTPQSGFVDAGGTRGRFAWALYDWAGQAFHTLIVTFVFAAYFSQGIVGDDVRGQELWGAASSISGLFVALLAPIIGAVADAGGPRKPWLLAFSAIAAAASALLWWAEPDTAFILWAMVWFAVAGVAFEFCQVFANAMLPDIAPASRVGRWSGWGWGMGYAGGLVSITLALVLFVQTDTPLFGLDKSAAEHVRIVGPMTAAWLVAFAIPMFLWTPDRAAKVAGLGAQARSGLADLVRTLRAVRRYGDIVRFLVARMLYADGLTTVFVFGGIYAAGAFGMELAEVLLFGIVLNLTAGVGAIAFGWIDDHMGPKRTILLSLAGLFVTATGALVVTSVTGFWVFGSALGIFVGPAQAASRSLMSRLAPAAQRTEFFGLYALTGKATAFLGPALVAMLTAATDSQRWGLSVLLLFFAGGAALLLTVREPAAGG